MKKIFASLFFAFLLVAGLGATVAPARAASIVTPEIISDTECTTNCTLNTFVKLGLSVANVILGLVGALTLAVFIYGGIRMLVSGGNAESVAAGKKSLVGGVVGLMIVFGSYMIIKVTVDEFLQPTAEFKFKDTLPKDNPPKDSTSNVLGKACRDTLRGKCVSATASCLGSTQPSDCGAKSVCCIDLCGNKGGACISKVSGSNPCGSADNYLGGDDLCGSLNVCCKKNSNVSDRCEDKGGVCKVVIMGNDPCLPEPQIPSGVCDSSGSVCCMKPGNINNQN